MSGYLKWVTQPTALLLFSVLLVVLAMAVVVPFDRGSSEPRPLALQSDEQEIVWLYPATSTTQWERFAKAVEQARQRLESRYPGLEWSHDAESVGSSNVSPSISLSWPKGRLVFRWYKLTSQWGPGQWLRALVRRDPPPLAIIGGNNSTWARRIAREMRALKGQVPEAYLPLLLLTTATADSVPDVIENETEKLLATGCDGEERDNVPLSSIYPERTFRFCFTNSQMANAVTRFVWTRPELTPIGDITYLVRWCDDAYSRDLCRGYLEVLPRRAIDTAIPQWLFLHGAVTLQLPGVGVAGWYGGGYRHEASFQIPIDSSIGGFASPNPYEANAVVRLLNNVSVEQRRPLLVLTGQQPPSRRFLRELARSEPDRARRFVVAMGDAIPFNTIYRDRQVTWPIQDLPFQLVLFAHRNPIDPGAGFLPSEEVSVAERSRSSGTEDLLLFRDVVEACALASRHENRLCESATCVLAGLRKLRIDEDRLNFDEGKLLFDSLGQRAGSTGEHVVYLRPTLLGERVLSQATVEVWTYQNEGEWRQVGESLSVSFNEFEVHRGERSR